MDIRKVITGMAAFAVMATGMVWAGVEDKAKGAETPAVTQDCAGGDCSQAAVNQTPPPPQKVKIPGVAIINPDNPSEAILLVQVGARTPEGKIVPQMVGIKIDNDENGKKLISEYGIKSVKPENPEAAKAAQKEAQEKFVMVSGVVKFDQNRPIITVEKFESAKNLLAKAPAPEKTENTKSQTAEDKKVN